MSCDETIALPELVQLQRGYDLATGKRRPGSIPVVASAGVVGRHDEAKCQPPGVVIGRSGSIGGAQFLNEPYWPLNTTLWVRDFHGNDAYYVYWLLKSLDLSYLNAGSGVPTLNRNHLGAVFVRVFETDEQRRIAWVLGSLDDKIELNRRLARTLEEIAAAIFKARFIDFEGVTEFQDSEIGPIPKGWRESRLGEVTSVTRGRSYTSAELSPSETGLVTLKSFNRGGGYNERGAKAYVGDYKPEQVIMPGEVVVAHTDLTQARDVIGRPARVRSSPQFDVLVASLDLAVVRPAGERVSSDFLLGLLASRAFRIHAFAHANGSTVLHLDSSAIGKFRFALPPARALDEFAQLSQPLYRGASALEEEATMLEAARDALLPKLISGSVGVPEGVGPDVDPAAEAA